MDTLVDKVGSEKMHREIRSRWEEGDCNTWRRPRDGSDGEGVGESSWEWNSWARWQ
jgi:hypothetical protein